MASTLSAADLERKHAAAHAAAAGGSTGNSNTAVPLEDPFPALIEDPFPPTKNGNSGSGNAAAAAVHDGYNAAAAGTEVGNGAPASKQTANKRAAQPDFSSESAFPSLGAAAAPPKGSWSKKLAVGASGSGSAAAAASASPAANWSLPVIARSTAQESFTIPYDPEQAALQPNKLGQVIQRVQTKYPGIKVDASTTRKNGITTFVVKGQNEANVKAARREITVLLAKSVTLTVMIPASLRAHVIGAKGKTLKGITDQTGVRINVPKQDPNAVIAAASTTPAGEQDYDDEEQIPVTIEGDEINANTAAKLLQAVVAERTSKTTVRLTDIDHKLYPFIQGPHNANASRLEKEAELGNGEVQVRIPPRAALLSTREVTSADADDGTNDTAPAIGDTNGKAAGHNKDQRERDPAIVLAGDREAVQRVVAEIERQVAEMNSTYRTLTINIPKRQHRFLIGDHAHEILAASSCSVELSSHDDPSDVVVIRGPSNKLPSGLTAVMDKANSVRVEVLDLVAAHRDFTHAKRLLRWLITSGKLPRGNASSGAAQVFIPRNEIIESSGQVQLEIVGAQEAEVVKLRESLFALVRGVTPAFVKEVEIDPLVHRLIIGRKGTGLKGYDAKGIDVKFPPAAAAASTDGAATAGTRADVLLVLSNPPADLPADKKAREAKAAEILEAAAAELKSAEKLAADIRTEKVACDPKHFRTVVGPNATTLNAVIGEERAVHVHVPNASSGDASASASKEDREIVVRGPSAEVERVVKALRAIISDAEQDSIVNGHVAELSVEQAHVPHLVGRGGAAITKLKEELGVRIDIADPSAAGAAAAAAANDAAAGGAEEKKKGPAKKKAAAGGGASLAKVTITGRKENVEEAKKRLQTQVARLADETQIVVKIPANLHGSIIGTGGKYVTRLQDTYAVRINFPNANGDSVQKPDEVVIKGGKKGVESAKAELLELVEYEKENNNVLTFEVAAKSISRIVGKSGAMVNQIRDDTDAQIDIDREAETNKDGAVQIRVRGTKKAVAAAKAAILELAAEAEDEVSFKLDIPASAHGELIGPGGSAIRDLVIRCGGPDDARIAARYVVFPKKGAADANAVTVQAPSAIAKKIKSELEKVAGDVGSRVVYGVVIAQPQHRVIIGKGGARKSELQSIHNVRLVFPGWDEYASTGEPVNAAELSGGTAETIIKIVGKRENCEALAKELKEEYTTVTRQITLARTVANKIGKPQFFVNLRNTYSVSVDTPRNTGKEAASSSAAGAKNGNSSAAAPAAVATAAAGAGTGAGASAARIDADEAELDSDDENGGLVFHLEALVIDNADEAADKVTWTLSGRDNASVDRAAKAVESAISKAKAQSHVGRLYVERADVPRIIGKKGAGLAALQGETGANVEIPREGGAQEAVCIITGSEDAVLAARDRLVSIVSSRRRYD
ncbi:hypothetical protein OC835_003218 [Tilletia horrida]|uniref:K Homology domain-containing protein n=1 Tax=Tilletia horrida TaxID=155126 RepID=A0AAN6JKK3_9BASI|nr:hypothetical protein OC842_003662 [Tilletia horrida]KAK0532805.1 hypothetical protein OC835_003218 [Tilletia horrida]